MNILTLTEAQSLHADAIESTEEGSQAVAAILDQLITHLDTSDKVVQIANSTNNFRHQIVALKGDGTLWNLLLEDGAEWKSLPSPE